MKKGSSMKKYIFLVLLLSLSVTHAEAKGTNSQVKQPLKLECIGDKEAVTALTDALEGKCIEGPYALSNGRYKVLLPQTSECQAYTNAKFEVWLNATDEYMDDISKKVNQNWIVPKLEFKRTDKPILVEAIITKDGTVYATSIKESSEPLGGSPITFSDANEQNYYVQLKNYYHQNHLIADNSAKVAVDTTRYPPMPIGIVGDGLKVVFAFNLADGTVKASKIRTFYGDKAKLPKVTPPQNVHLVPKPKTLHEIQMDAMAADAQRQRDLQAEQQKRMLENSSRSAVIYGGLNTLQQALPLFWQILRLN